MVSARPIVFSLKPKNAIVDCKKLASFNNGKPVITVFIRRTIAM